MPGLVTDRLLVMSFLDGIPITRLRDSTKFQKWAGRGAALCSGVRRSAVPCGGVHGACPGWGVSVFNVLHEVAHREVACWFSQLFFLSPAPAPDPSLQEGGCAAQHCTGQPAMVVLPVSCAPLSNTSVLPPAPAAACQRQSSAWRHGAYWSGWVKNLLKTCLLERRLGQGLFEPGRPRLLTY